MKTKLLFRSAILFLVLGFFAKDGVLFYFFSVHLFMLTVAVFLYKREFKPGPKNGIERLPQADLTAES